MRVPIFFLYRAEFRNMVSNIDRALGGSDDESEEVSSNSSSSFNDLVLTVPPPSPQSVHQRRTTPPENPYLHPYLRHASRSLQNLLP